MMTDEEAIRYIQTYYGGKIKSHFEGTRKGYYELDKNLKEILRTVYYIGKANKENFNI